MTYSAIIASLAEKKLLRSIDRDRLQTNQTPGDAHGDEQQRPAFLLLHDVPEFVRKALPVEIGVGSSVHWRIIQPALLRPSGALPAVLARLSRIVFDCFGVDTDVFIAVRNHVTGASMVA